MFFRQYLAKSDGRYEYWVTPNCKFAMQHKERESTREERWSKRSKLEAVDYTENRYKRGFEREDGRIFYKYAKQHGRRYERWETKEKYESYKVKGRADDKKRRWKDIAETRRKAKEYIQRDLKKWRERKVKYNKMRRETDSLFKFRWVTSETIKRAIREIRSGPRILKCEEILGLPFEDFMAYMEARFDSRMNWKNHTRKGWHIDHIIPSVYGKTEEDVLILNHHLNLRPLWWDENLAKGDTLPDDVEEKFADLKRRIKEFEAKKNLDKSGNPDSISPTNE